jgi:hypothetical protein
VSNGTTDQLLAQLEETSDPLACADLRRRLGELVHDDDPAEAQRHFQAAAVELARAAQLRGELPAAPLAALRDSLRARELWEGEMALCEVQLMFAPSLAALSAALRAMAELARSRVGPEAADLNPEQLVAATLGGVLACDDAHDLGNTAPLHELVERIALDDAWFAQAFPAAGAPFLAHVYREIFAGQTGEVLRALANAARGGGELQVTVVEGPESREATGHQRAVYAVLREPITLLNVAIGGTTYPGFLIDAGHLRWLGKFNISILAEENQRLFELACAGHAAGFDPPPGEAGVRAWIEHLAERAREAGAL